MNGSVSVEKMVPSTSNAGAGGLSRAERLKQKKKAREAVAKKERRERKQAAELEKQHAQKGEQVKRKDIYGNGDDQFDENIVIEYVTPTITQMKATTGSTAQAEDDVGGDLFDRFSSVFEKFIEKDDDDEEEGANKTTDDNGGNDNGGDGQDGYAENGNSEFLNVEESDLEVTEQDGESLSRKKKKLLQRKKIAELKKSTSRPDIIEVWDTTAADPEILIHLKSCRNSVPVPVHWSQKRKFLQGKRGLEKPAWALPEFIAATGITEMREVYKEKEESQKLKTKSRERLRPKTGKLDIDYQVLHDAFFRFQTKPKLTGVGELYFEGKEFEAEHEYRPGHLSLPLKRALGMPEGAPPPWLINMQRYGPPPSYPNLKMAGLNAPLPPGATYGYHPGGWGKPPVDEYGAPVYGNPFGESKSERDIFDAQGKESKLWGELEEEEDDDEEDEEEDDEEDEDEDEEEAFDDDISTLGEEDVRKGTASVATTVGGAPSLDLRKQTGINAGLPPQGQLYQVLQSQTTAVGEALMGSDHKYILPGQQQNKSNAIPNEDGQREVTLRPEEIDQVLEGEQEDIADKYREAGQKEREARMAMREDFSDMVAEYTAGQKRKSDQKSKAEKKKKFKF